MLHSVVFQYTDILCWYDQIDSETENFPHCWLGGANNILKQLLVLIDVLLISQESKTTVYYLVVISNAVDEVRLCLCVQAQHHPDITANLVRLVQTYFKETFRQVFVGPLPVWRTCFAPLVRKLTIGQFQANIVSITSIFKEQQPPLIVLQNHQDPSPPPTYSESDTFTTKQQQAQ